MVLAKSVVLVPPFLPASTFSVTDFLTPSVLQPAVRTTVQLLQRFMHGGAALSQVSVQIGTGRKHQIRSQLAHVGHPVLRDAL